MHTGTQKKFSLRHSRLTAFLVPLAGFLLILLAMNMYQYLRVKSDLASTVINEIGDNELAELKSFFTNLTSKITIVHDWGKNGVLSEKDIISLNKKFIPLVDRQEQISGLLLANDQGREYFLYRDAKGWVTRISEPGKNGTRMHFTRWLQPDRAGKSWEKTSSYDPRKRPWFHKPSPQGEQVSWTPLYTFFETGEPGVTASISWNNPEGKSGFTVFALDIPLGTMRATLTRLGEKRPGILFLVNSSGSIAVSSRQKIGVREQNKQSTGPSVQNNPAQKIIREWIGHGKPAEKPISVQINGKRWIASLRPLNDVNVSFWLGAAAPENELLKRINETLFKVDSIDLLVALAGGMLLFLLVWRTGGFHRGQETMPPLSPLRKLHRYLERGEGADLEFKSTVRTNLKSGKQGKEIELAWLKAVVAFLNSDGGTLLIGVADNASVLGLEADRFENADRCLLHMKNLINHHIGAEFSRCIEMAMVEDEGKQVVIVECEPATEPVFLRIGKNEEFYIRSGPSSVKLSPSQMVSYILQNRVAQAAADNGRDKQ